MRSEGPVRIGSREEGVAAHVSTLVGSRIPAGSPHPESTPAGQVLWSENGSDLDLTGRGKQVEST